MPYSITTKDGITLQNIPDDIAPDAPELKQRVGAIRAGMKPTPSEEPTTRQKVQSSMLGRVLQGVRDPIDGLAQLAPRGASAVASGMGLFPNPVSKFFDSEATRVDTMNATNEAEYQKSRVATQPRTLSTMITGPQDPGFDGARLVGNVISPVNAVPVARLPAATTTLGRIGVGVAAGAFGGAAAPVDMKDGQDYASAKSAQVATGAVLGGALSPLAGKIGDKVQTWAAGRKATANATQLSVEDVARVSRQVAAETGTKWEDLSQQAQAELAAQVKSAMTSRVGKDPAALARQADFNAEGMKGTLGQITRDARQYANERNLRQLPGTGDPLLTTFENQGRQLAGKVNEFATGAKPRYQAGTDLEGSLRGVDEKLRKGVTSAYQQARAAAGKDAELPLTGLAQDAADVMDRFGDKVPSGVVNQLKKYGILPDQAGQAAPRKLFTVESMDDLLKVINSHGSATDMGEKAALDALRAAVKRTVTAAPPKVTATPRTRAPSNLEKGEIDSQDFLGPMGSFFDEKAITPVLKTVPLSSLYPTQTGVSKQIASKYAKEGAKGPLVVIDDGAGGFAISDGHHRAVAAAMRGETSVPVKVVAEAANPPTSMVEDVFAPARKLAAERFSMHDAIPALEAAAKGTTAADDFVNRFIVNGKTDEVAGMAKLLKANAPESYQQARSQVGEKLREAAFGQNVAGDKSFSVERYAKALKDLGPDKLKAFFSADEVARLERLGRIGAYMNQFPNASPVQTSNNWGAIMSLAGRIPGVSTSVNVAKTAATAIGNTSAVRKAVAADVPKTPPQLDASDVRKLSQLLGLGAAAAGGAAAEPLK